MPATVSPVDRPRGRPTALTPTKASAFLQAMAAGNYVKTAAQYAGTAPTTVRNWVNIGEVERHEWEQAHPDDSAEETIDQWLEQHPTPGYTKDTLAACWDAEPPTGFNPLRWPAVVFSVLYEKTSAEAEVRAVTQIQQAARQTQHWTAAMTFLERRFPDRWRRQDRVGVEGVEGGQPITVQPVTTAELTERIAQLRAAVGQPAAPERRELEA